MFPSRAAAKKCLWILSISCLSASVRHRQILNRSCLNTPQVLKHPWHYTIQTDNASPTQNMRASYETLFVSATMFPQVVKLGNIDRTHNVSVIMFPEVLKLGNIDRTHVSVIMFPEVVKLGNIDRPTHNVSVIMFPEVDKLGNIDNAWGFNLDFVSVCSILFVCLYNYLVINSSRHHSWLTVSLFFPRCQQSGDLHCFQATFWQNPV